MSVIQHPGEGFVLLQTGLDALRKEYSDREVRLNDAQRQLDQSQKQVEALEGEKSALVADNAQLQKAVGDRTTLQEQVSKLAEQLADCRTEKHAVEKQFTALQKKHEEELERAKDAAREAQATIKDFRQRNAVAAEEAARVPGLEAELKQYKDLVGRLRNVSAEQLKLCEALQSGSKEASRRRNADVISKMNSMMAVKGEKPANVTEGTNGTTNTDVPAENNAMPDATTEVTSSVVRPRGRPRKNASDAAVCLGRSIAVKSGKRGTSKKRPRKTVASGEGVPCCHEPCQKPMGESADWVKCSRCIRWYHCVCLNETPNEDNWVCGHCPSC